jgi:cytochrome d ubiquinol oxidase subunit I
MTFVSFHNMVILGVSFISLMFLGALLWWKKRLLDARWYQKALLIASPFPLVACQFGWVTTEVGRQPWIVYKLLRTADAISVSVPAASLLISLIALGLVSATLLSLYLFLVLREMKHGPQMQAAKELV